MSTSAPHPEPGTPAHFATALEAVSLALGQVNEARDALERSHGELQVASDILARALGIVGAPHEHEPDPPPVR